MWTFWGIVCGAILGFAAGRWSGRSEGYARGWCDHERRMATWRPTMYAGDDEDSNHPWPR